MRRISVLGKQLRRFSTSSEQPRVDKEAQDGDLNFAKAAEVLWSTAERPARLGLDFHIWQAIVACLPPLAVYWTAQYARSEMNRLEKLNNEKTAQASPQPPRPAPPSPPSPAAAAEGKRAVAEYKEALAEIEVMKARLSELEEWKSSKEGGKAESEAPKGASVGKGGGEGANVTAAPAKAEG